MDTQKEKNKKIALNGGLILCVILLAVLPLITLKDAPFSGADGQVADHIQEIAPDYVPWFSSPFRPPSGEIESLLFAVQAGIGTGIIGFGLGYLYGKRKKDEV